MYKTIPNVLVILLVAIASLSYMLRIPSGIMLNIPGGLILAISGIWHVAVNSKRRFLTLRILIILGLCALYAYFTSIPVILCFLVLVASGSIPSLFRTLLGVVVYILLFLFWVASLLVFVSTGGPDMYPSVGCYLASLYFLWNDLFCIWFFFSLNNPSKMGVCRNGSVNAPLKNPSLPRQ